MVIIEHVAIDDMIVDPMIKGHLIKVFVEYVESIELS